MNRRNVLLLRIAVAVSFVSPCFAGPCTLEVDAMQVKLNARLNAAAAAGPSGTQTTAATMHRQPTPESIAAAEARLGDISPEKAQEIGEVIKLARKADQDGDSAGCEKALARGDKILAE